MSNGKNKQTKLSLIYVDPEPEVFITFPLASCAVLRSAWCKSPSGRMLVKGWGMLEVRKTFRRRRGQHYAAQTHHSPFILLCLLQPHPQHPLTSPPYYLLTSLTTQWTSGSNPKKGLLRITFIFSTPLGNIVPHLPWLIRILTDLKANIITIRTPLISMQLRKWLILNSLFFFPLEKFGDCSDEPAITRRQESGGISEIKETPQRVISDLPFAAGGLEGD